MIVDQKLFQHLQLLVIVLLLSWRVTFEHSTGMEDGIRCIKKEREALLKFKAELIDEYGRLSSWGNEIHKKDCCKWSGVLCDKQTNHVVELDLHGLSDDDEYTPLRGNINIWLLEIKDLKYLNLSHNDFNDSRIPQFIGSLDKLQHLDLSSSDFSGEIPHQLGNLSELNSLILGEGSLISTNLDWLSRLHSLNELSMAYVNLTMATNWFQAITNLTQLKVLNLYSCYLPFPSPYTFSASNSLSVLHLRRNRFTSSWIFPLLFNLSSSLTSLDLSDNDFNQSRIPQFIGSLHKLQHLDLSYSNFSGEIPHPLGNLSELNSLLLDTDDVGSLISTNLDWLSRLHSLNELHMAFVNLTMATNWLQTITKLTQLKELDLSFCDLPMVLPSSPYTFSASNSLSVLHLRGNGFTSSWIFPLLFNLSSSLTSLDLSDNDFNQSRIPQFIGSLHKLQHLDLSRSNFSGEIPHPLGNLSELNSLLLDTDDDGSLISTNLDWLSRLHSLNKLSMFRVNLTMATNWLQTITNLTHLTELSLSSCHLSMVLPPSPYTFSASNSLSVLDLSGNGFTSSWIFPLLFNLSSSLTSLGLSSNELQGEIPTFLGNMSSLSVLSLFGNQLTGAVPHHALSSSLTSLYLSYNMFNGSVTQWIGSLSKLETLYLGSNNFEGIITESHFFNLSQLGSLDLSYNPGISFNISIGWNPPFQLTYLDLAGCKVGPRFPAWLRTQTRLEYLHISNAEISDTFPDWFWELSPKLLELNASHNNFHGVLPDLSSKFPAYVYFIDLSFNHFNGTLPILPPNGEVLDLSSNEFSGSITDFCDETSCDWEYLDLSNNLLSGQLPDCFANLPNLEFLKLAHNNFSGKIPSLNIGSSLHLQNNSFTGEIPTSLRYCTSLTFIDLSRNKLMGKIPTWVGDAWTKLVFLSLKSNEFFGSIPSNLCHLAHLQVLDFSLNKISGGIPKCLNNLTAMSQVDSKFNESFLLSYAFVEGFESAILTWKGNEAEYINTLKLVKLIDLSSNNLVGDIPIEITNLVMLVGLNLSRNNLSGFLPPNIERLRTLDFLDLSRNHFSGKIPTGVSQLDQLGVLDLSYNNLSGKIPQSIHLQTFNSSAFEGNPLLCGPPLTKVCPGDEIARVPKISDNADGKKNPEEEDKLINHGFYISMATGFFFGFWGVCGTLVFNNSWRIAFFKSWNSVMDWFYVKTAIGKIRLREAYHKFVKF